MRKIEAVKEIQLQIKKAIETCSSERKLSFLLAVSGGRDSSVLLDAFSSLIPKTSFFVAHFNHGLRPEADKEQSFVESLCKSISVEYLVKKAEPYNQKENLESWARTCRYQFLEDARAQSGADLIVTAHHKTDLAETVLMRVISGRGAISLGGIIGLDFDRKLFRPMLDIPRELINCYVAEKSLQFVEDSSNTNLDRTRNRLRLELIPQVEKDFNPGFIDSLCSFAQRINQDEKSIWLTAKRLYHESEDSSRADFYAAYPHYLRWRLLKLELDSKVGENKVGYNSLCRLSEALDSKEGSPKLVELGWGVSCEFSRKGLLKFQFIANNQP